MSHISTVWDSSFRHLLLTLMIATDVCLEDRHPHLLDLVTTGRCHTTHRAHLHHLTETFGFVEVGVQEDQTQLGPSDVDADPAWVACCLSWRKRKRSLGSSDVDADPAWVACCLSWKKKRKRSLGSPMQWMMTQFASGQSTSF